MNRNESRLAIKRAISKLGCGIYRNARPTVVWDNPPSPNKHQVIVPSATYAPWLNNVDFLHSYGLVKGNTLVDLFRCYELWLLGEQSCKVQGDILEVGVWRGGSGALLAQSVRSDPSKKIYLADTFTGVVKAGGNDPKYSGGEHSDTSVELVESLLSRNSIVNSEVIVGIFPEESGHLVRGPLALVHCDVDVYESAKDVFEWCVPRLSIGSMVIFDDFGFSGCEGVATLCEEIADRSDFIFIHNLNGHAIFIKIR